MEDEPEMIELSSFDDFSSSMKSSNFGGGLELLMNDKKTSKPSSDIEVDDLNQLENELNDLVDETPSSKNLFSGKSDFFSKSFSLNSDDKPSVHFDDNNDSNNSGMNSSSNLGQSTSQTASDNKTWDG